MEIQKIPQYAAEDWAIFSWPIPATTLATSYGFKNKATIHWIYAKENFYKIICQNVILEKFV